MPRNQYEFNEEPPEVYAAGIEQMLNGVDWEGETPLPSVVKKTIDGIEVELNQGVKAEGFLATAAQIKRNIDRLKDR